MRVHSDYEIGHWGERERVAGFLCWVRVATAGQVARYVCSGDRDAAERLLAQMTSDEGGQKWVGRKANVEIVTAGRRLRTEVYYLTQAGLMAVHHIAPKVARLAKPGEPRGNNLARVPHELGVTEAFLHIHERHEIVRWMPETELMSINKVAANQATLLGDLPPDENTGDFKAVVREHLPGGHLGPERTIHGEVAVEYRLPQVRKKPRGMDWFVTSDHQYDLVEKVFGVKSVRLGDLRAPLSRRETAEARGVKVSPPSRKTMAKGLPAQVLGALERAGGAGTATAVAKLLGQRRDNVSRALASLRDEGTLLFFDAHMVTGATNGKRVRVYHRHDVSAKTVFEKERLVLASATILYAHDTAYSPESYDAARGLMVLRTKEEGDCPALLLMDDAAREPEEMRAEAEKLLEDALGGALPGVVAEGHEAKLRELIGLIMADKRRYQQLEGIEFPRLRWLTEASEPYAKKGARRAGRHRSIPPRPSADALAGATHAT